MSRFEARRAAKLKQLAECSPFVAASLCQVNRRCGHPNCKCAKGLPHRAHVLTYKVKGKSKAVHVPKDLLREVQKWVEEYRRIKKLIAEVSGNSLAIIHRYVRVNRAVRRNLKRSRT